MSQYALTIIIGIVKALMDRAGVPQRDPNLYQIVLSNISNVSSDLHRRMMTYVNQQTGGQWQNGVNEHTFGEIMRPWVQDTLNQLTMQLRMQYQQQQPVYPGYPPQPGYNYNPAPAPGFSPTAVLYDSGTQPSQVQPPPPSVQTDWKLDVIQSAPSSEKGSSMPNFDLGRIVNIVLNPADTLQHHPKPGNVIGVSNYQEGSFENTRISTIEVTLNTAENNIDVAAEKALEYSPNEIIRGVYANVLLYKEIFHLPISTVEFRRIATIIGEQFYGKTAQKMWDWRHAVTAMSTLSRAEHKVFETALIQILNPSIVKFLRTTNGEVIEGIDEIDDLNELDNPRSKLKVTQHPRYLRALDEIVARAFDTLINPSNQIFAEDKNFGDFVHCDKIEFWHDDRSKYDYGTYLEKADRLKFVGKMTSAHTVLRIRKTAIITNSIDYQSANNISYFHPKQAVKLVGMNNVGFKLILSLDQSKQELEGIICVGDPSSGREPNKLIHMGMTLDGDYVLIK